MKAGILDLHREASRVLARLLPNLEQELTVSIQGDPQAWQAFTQHLETHFDHLFQLYHRLYGKRYDMLYHCENLLKSMAQASFERPADLRELDRQREQDPLWFQSNQVLGGCVMWIFSRATWKGSAQKFRISKSSG
jgi:amylosucrase